MQGQTSGRPHHTEIAPDAVTLGERLLLRFCRDPDAPDYRGGTARATPENALDFLEKTVPDVLGLISGREVLDFGCGAGFQALAMARRGARHVTGVDLARDVLLRQWHDLAAIGCPNLELTTTLPADRSFDVVVSCSSFEHFSAPEAILAEMRERVRPGGRVVITFAEPWWSPYGSHMDGITRLPWVNVFFSERTVMRVRSRFRTDGATRYEDVEGGLNRMTIGRFERLMQQSRMEIESLRLFSVRGLPLVDRLPLVREFFTSAASCVLLKPDDEGRG